MTRNEAFDAAKKTARKWDCPHYVLCCLDGDYIISPQCHQPFIDRTAGISRVYPDGTIVAVA